MNATLASESRNAIGASYIGMAEIVSVDRAGRVVIPKAIRSL
jgi:DNA-binding transcriptional regulator/RsmH inhibitor MraZ